MRSRFGAISPTCGRTCSPTAMPTATMPRRRRVVDGDGDVPHDGRRLHRREVGDRAALGPYVSDAIANRGGLVLLGMNHATESGGVTQFHTCANTLDGKPRLRVDYRSSALIAVDDPRPQLGASVPAADVASADKPA